MDNKPFPQLKRRLFTKWAGVISALCLFMMINGCASFVSSYSTAVTTKMAGNLSKAFLNHNDLATVETGAPAYLLMVDSFLMDNPDNESLLLASAKLYTSYTTAFVTDTARAKRLSLKGFDAALRAACNRYPDICEIRVMPFDAFSTFLSRTERDDLPMLYALGTAWASFLEAHRSDWKAIAELPRVEAIMNRVVMLDETFEDGGAHMYLGVFGSLIPPALGGRPEVGKAHFEEALHISGKKNLMAYVLYAKHYAKMLFDRELHDRLLNEVLTADPNVEDYVLINMAAQVAARNMLAEADDYF